MELIDDEGNHWELTKVPTKTFNTIHAAKEIPYKLTNFSGTVLAFEPYQITYMSINIGGIYYGYKPRNIVEENKSKLLDKLLENTGW